MKTGDRVLIKQETLEWYLGDQHYSCYSVGDTFDQATYDKDTVAYMLMVMGMEGVIVSFNGNIHYPACLIEFTAGTINHKEWFDTKGLKCL